MHYAGVGEQAQGGGDECRFVYWGTLKRTLRLPVYMNIHSPNLSSRPLIKRQKGNEPSAADAVTTRLEMEGEKWTS